MMVTIIKEVRSNIRKTEHSPSLLCIKMSLDTLRRAVSVERALRKPKWNVSSILQAYCTCASSLDLRDRHFGCSGASQILLVILLFQSQYVYTPRLYLIISATVTQYLLITSPVISGVSFKYCSDCLCELVLYT